MMEDCNGAMRMMMANVLVLRSLRSKAAIKLYIYILALDIRV